MTFIQTQNASGNFDQTGFDFVNGSKKVRVGTKGVLAARMLLDPLAQTEPTNGSNDYLYIAAGRDGLWFMQADVSSTTNEAWLIDDSGNANVATQNSRRWCSDVDVMTIDGERYLVATFGKKSKSRLRVYRLADVHAIAASPIPMPIAALVEVTLGNHPYFEIAGNDIHALTPYEYGRSVAGAMCVDSYIKANGDECADIYVSMGHHGLVRIGFCPEQFSGTLTPPSVDWGPVMGNDTHYAVGVDALYGHMLYRSSPNDRPYLEEPIIDRAERPFFNDVLVERDTPANSNRAHLYTTVDHLGWMRFDVKDRLTWNQTMAIDHHEGVEIAKDCQDDGGVLTDCIPMVAQFPDAVGVGNGEEHGYATGLALVEHPTHGPILAVTYDGSPLVTQLFNNANEGVTYGSDLEWGGTHASDLKGTRRTIFYRVDPGVAEGGFSNGVLSLTPGFNFDNWFDAGGVQVRFPSIQPSGDELNVIHNYRLPDISTFDQNLLGFCLSVVHPGAFPQGIHLGAPLGTYLRSIDSLEGSQAFGLVQSVVDPESFIISANDGKFPSLGFLSVTGPASDPSLQVQSTAASTFGPAGSHRMDAGSVWAGPNAGEEYLLSSGVILDDLGKGDRWMLMKYQHSSGSPPTITNKWTFLPFDDSYGLIPRPYYLMAGHFPKLNDFLEAGGHEPLVFGTRLSSPEGLSVFGRDDLILKTLLQPLAQDDAALTATGLILANPRQLVTHPEFNNMPRDTNTAEGLLAKDWWLRAGKIENPNGGADLLMDPGGSIHTSAPRAIEVRNIEDTAWGKWVIAVPCGKINADPDWTIFTDHTGWLPTPGSLWEQEQGHGLVQFWEVAEVGTVPTTYWRPIGSELIPTDPEFLKSALPKAIGSRNPGLTWEVDSVRIGDKAYALVSDLTGAIYAYEVQDILSAADPNNDVALDIFAEWSTPPSLFDDLDNIILDLEVLGVDQGKAYLVVAVRRVGVVHVTFDPTAGAGAFTDTHPSGTLQTSEYASALIVQPVPVADGGGERLIVSDYGGGVRVYGR
ncbi:MAG: hypothetical protein ACI8QC_000804 [Planctomycetota bacterium]|jgi:hypothetical protein